MRGKGEQMKETLEENKPEHRDKEIKSSILYHCKSYLQRKQN